MSERVRQRRMLLDSKEVKTEKGRATKKMMNLHKQAKELRELARQVVTAADILDGRKKPAVSIGNRVLSKEARRRISEVQKKRWAATKRKAA